MGCKSGYIRHRRKIFDSAALEKSTGGRFRSGGTMSTRETTPPADAPITCAESASPGAARNLYHPREGSITDEQEAATQAREENPCWQGEAVQRRRSRLGGQGRVIGLYSPFALLCVIIDRIFINPFRKRRS